MAKYDGLIIPRSYNDYINKSDPLGVSQTLQLTGVMDDTPTAGSSKPVKSSGLVGLSAVDVVETDNMHSVTSNAVSRAMSYSTTEQKTGGVWIDGKPIYRKVVDCGNAPNGSSQLVASEYTNHNISNIGAITKLDLYASYNSPFSVLSVPFIDGQGNEIDGFIDSTKITIRANNNASGYKVIAIIEYTKTTD